MNPRPHFLCVLFVLAMSFVGPVGCSTVAPPSSTPQPSAAQPGIANPASTHCVELGYRTEIRSGANGQTGVCIFPDGSECDEWAFMRGECGAKWLTPTK